MMKMRPIMTRMSMCPASMLAKSRTESERERDAQVRRRRVDPPGGQLEAGDGEALVRDRQRHEADHVQDPDEEEERGDVGKPAPDALRGEVALGDLPLEEVVERLARRLPAARPQREAEPHEPDAEQDRDRGADPEIDDRLVDRHVERAELQLDPGRQLELVRWIE